MYDIVTGSAEFESSARDGRRGILFMNYSHKLAPIRLFLARKPDPNYATESPHPWFALKRRSTEFSTMR